MTLPFPVAIIVPEGKHVTQLLEGRGQGVDTTSCFAGNYAEHLVMPSGSGSPEHIIGFDEPYWVRQCQPAEIVGRQGEYSARVWVDHTDAVVWLEKE
jgi:hypothetical protein